MENDLRKHIESLEAENRLLKSKIEEKTHQLLTFFSIITRALDAESLDEQLNLIAEGITDARLFRRAIISFFSDDFESIDVGYSGLTPEEIAEHRKKPSISKEIWLEILSDEYRISNSYFVSHDCELTRRIGGIKSILEKSSFPGGWHPADMLFVPLRGSGNKLLGVISIDDPLDGKIPNIDSMRVTELFAREAAGLIERSDLTRKFFGMQQYLSKLIESSIDMIVASNKEGRIVLFNSGAEKMLGYSNEEVIGNKVEMLYESGEEAHKIMQMMRDGNGNIQSEEVNAKTKSGTIIPISLSAAILYDENGAEIGTEGISKDLRPIKALQKKVMELKRKDDIRMVAVTLSHHINNYLQSLIVGCQDVEETFQSDNVIFPKTDMLKSVEDHLTNIKLDVLRIAHLTRALSNPPDELAIDDYLDGIKMLRLPDDMAVSIEKHDHEGHQKLQGNGNRILVADDERTVRDGIAEFLSAHGFIVDTAKDGAEAIEMIEKNADRYRAVISDIKMPYANGYEVFRAAKKANPSVVVVLMTAFGYDDNHTLVKASHEGLKARLFKEKPFDMNDVLKALREALSNEHSES